MARGASVQTIIVLLVLASSRAQDLDGDGIDDLDDSCPFDRENDKDNDGICANNHCRDDPSFKVNFIGSTCAHFEPGNAGHGQCWQYQKSNMGTICFSCSCACKHEAACGFDPCPSDPQNDADKDGICGDVDSCPLDKSNDLDSDGICEHEDSCPLDPENDKDGDNICGNLDSCPQDRHNDADNDLLCRNEDACPSDPLNDIDSDNICGNWDTCPMDKNNDEDGDNLCTANECFDDPSFASRKGYACSSYVADPTRCAPESVSLSRGRKVLDVCTSCSCACSSQVECGYDPCPLDKENDADGDNLCANEDVCPHDPHNDADSDNICGDVDSCPLDKDNDVDGDKLCDASECFDDEHFTSDTGYTCSEYRSVKGFCYQESTVEKNVCTACSCACAGEHQCGNKLDPCPNDEHNDKDGDGLCGDVDSCPLDKENDIDGDELCADVDPCPKDPLADTDSDNLCSQQDKCPDDPENDIDGDLLCAAEDPCPYEAESDFDSDNLCGHDDCPKDAQNDADSDNLCGDVDRCPLDKDNDIDGDMLCSEVDPCPNDFRPPVNGKCHEKGLQFSQLDSLQKSREIFPSTAITDDCQWSDGETASDFDLGHIQCVRAVQVFRLHEHDGDNVTTGSLAITAEIIWNSENQKKLMRYLASVAHVMPDRIFLSREWENIRNSAQQKKTYKGFRRHHHTVIINVLIEVQDLPYRPLRCTNPIACNFNTDTSDLFIASNTSNIDYCILSDSCTDVAESITEKNASPPDVSDAEDRRRPPPRHTFQVKPDDVVEQGTDCRVDYVYFGVGIGAGGSILVAMFALGMTYCVLRCKGYVIAKKSKEKDTNGTLSTQLATLSASLPAVTLPNNLSGDLSVAYSEAIRDNVSTVSSTTIISAATDPSIAHSISTLNSNDDASNYAQR